MNKLKIKEINAYINIIYIVIHAVAETSNIYNVLFVGKFGNSERKLRTTKCCYRQAWVAFAKLPARSLQVDLAICNAAVAAVGKGSEWSRAVAAVSGIQRQGVKM